MTLRLRALDALAISEPEAKCAAVAAIAPDAEVGADDTLIAFRPVPGAREKPALVPPAQLAKRSVDSRKGHAALIHSLVHIELNAIDLALDIVWRFAGLPDAFYRDWIAVAKEEAHHFQLLNRHLASLGYAYGDFPAHNGLWEMAEKTKDDLLARLALVPLTLEARGLDASPPIRAKLARIGDAEGVAILNVLLRDEIGHVATGNRWFKWRCEQEEQDPKLCYAQLTTLYKAPRAKGPFNVEARLAAGLDAPEP